MKSNTDIKSKITSTETVFKSKNFKINKIIVERNGKTFKKDIIVRNSTVVILPITDNKEIYFVSQYRDAHEKVLLELPAGNMDDGELEIGQVASLVSNIKPASLIVKEIMDEFTQALQAPLPE